MKETIQGIHEWAIATFGSATVTRSVIRAEDEFWELWNAIADEKPVDDILEEAADVVITLANLEGLSEAIDKKMAINRARKWTVHGDGTGNHVKEA